MFDVLRMFMAASKQAKSEERINKQRVMLREREVLIRRAANIEPGQQFGQLLRDIRRFEESFGQKEAGKIKTVLINQMFDTFGG